MHQTILVIYTMIYMSLVYVGGSFFVFPAFLYHSADPNNYQDHPPPGDARHDRIDQKGTEKEDKEQR